MIKNVQNRKKTYRQERAYNWTLHLLVERWLLKIAALYSKDGSDRVLYGDLCLLVVGTTSSLL